MEIKLQPTRSSCIETVAKREYERTLSELLKAMKEDEQLEQKLELLRLFLESADFRRLRNLTERDLLEGKRVEFILRPTRAAPGHEFEIRAT